MEKICPYPGLRPFTEDESVFFKGRDLHVKQIINQLEDKKIVMVTGASGDGKSSLVYAGVIPNARAGFFRAKYNNWIICDFRPERSPLKNLTETLSLHMDIDENETYEELSHGFSALASIYRSTPFYINTAGENWLKADEIERKNLKRQAANLFILADQFEEFFTNTENYTEGRPSNEAYTTVNLLLETARIAIRDDLPIYIVCTMRSDYISDCVAFKNLPEMIGFSQFFVPRLKRNELQQVIEEPAMLSGGSVSKRLVEILINDLREGFDQLPVLQHALNQLWALADDGDTELDLIHLAKLAGLPPKYLPEADFEEFNQWQKEIEPFRLQYYEKPSLPNVLNTHADILYNTSFNYFNKNIDWANKNITLEDALFIIKIAFQSLTKIDEGRGVRNRVTINEITRIINRNDINSATVCGVLNVFRLQDNTFIRPFVDDNDISTQYLSGETTLDITHEALIRNWELLKHWEEEEFENLTNFHDFKIQLNRWLENGKSKDFLLPIGPLSHFESWYESCKPNKYWISKYDKRAISIEDKYTEAEKIEDDTIEFIQQSKVNLIQIEKSKRRIRLVGFISAIVLILSLSGFSYWANQEKAEAQRQKQIAEERTTYAEEQREKALKANKLAELEKERAENNADRALAAKQQSDSAKSVAERMRIIAEDKTQLAKHEALTAKNEREKAEAQRLIAEQERLNAEKASYEAKRLSRLAIAQSVAYKATNKFEDKELNVLLALKAYNLNKANNGNPFDPAIYEALRYAHEVSGNEGIIQTGVKSPLKALQIAGNNAKVISLEGKIYNYNLHTGEIISQMAISDEALVVDRADFITNNLIITGLYNRQAFLFDSKSNTKKELQGVDHLLRGAIYIDSKNLLITADRGGFIRTWKPGNDNMELTGEMPMGEKINTIVGDNKMLFAGGNSGKLFKIIIDNKNFETIYEKNIRLTNLAYDKRNNLLFAGYADGELLVINAQNSFKKHFSLSVSNTMIKNISINDEGKLLAVSCPDKAILVYRIDNLNSNPYVIKNHNQQVVSLYFNGTVLYALGRNNQVFEWETNTEKLAAGLQKHKTRSLTNNEKERYVGKVE